MKSCWHLVKREGASPVMAEDWDYSKLIGNKLVGAENNRS